MITTEITIRQGVKTFNDDGLETGWSDVVVRSSSVTSNKVTVEHMIECKLKTKELLHNIDVEQAFLSAKVESDPNAEGYIGEGFTQHIESK